MRKTMKTTAILAAMSVMVLGTVVSVSAAEKNTWAEENGTWYYYDKDGVKLVNAWAQDSSGKWYFLGEDGKMQKDKFIDDDASLVVEHGNISIFSREDNKYYYVGGDGALVTGWAEVKYSSQSGPTGSDGKAWYYFSESGVMYGGEEWVLSDSKWYFLGDDGKMAKNALVDNRTYFVGTTGAMETGWVKITNDDAEDDLNVNDGTWIYLGTDGKPTSSKWRSIDGSWYYFGSVSTAAAYGGGFSPNVLADYGMNSGTFIGIGSDIFYLKSSGAMVTGWFKVGTDQYWADDKGRVAGGNTVKTISGKYYFFDTTGVYDADHKYASKTGDVYALESYANDTDAKAAATGGVEVYKLGTGTKWK